MKMKRRFSFCAKLMAALTVSAAMMLPAFPAVAESGTLSMLEDNNIPVVYLTIDENAASLILLKHYLSLVKS